jgi:hypothetical protein
MQACPPSLSLPFPAVQLRLQGQRTPPPPCSHWCSPLSQCLAPLRLRRRHRHLRPRKCIRPKSPSPTLWKIPISRSPRASRPLLERLLLPGWRILLCHPRRLYAKRHLLQPSPQKTPRHSRCPPRSPWTLRHQLLPRKIKTPSHSSCPPRSPRTLRQRRLPRKIKTASHASCPPRSPGTLRQLLLPRKKTKTFSHACRYLRSPRTLSPLPLLRLPNTRLSSPQDRPPRPPSPPRPP